MNTTPVSLLERLRDPGAQQAAWERFVELFTPLLFSWSRQLGLQAEDFASGAAGAIAARAGDDRWVAASEHRPRP
jgi:hypothetical protein